MGRSILDVIKGKKAEQPVAQPEIKHRQYCLDAQAAYEAWAKENPYHCRHCHGTGVTGKGTDSDTGFAIEDPCSHCVEEGNCPVCGIPLDEEDWEHCAACGWTFEDERTHAPYWECSCFEDEILYGLEGDTVEFYVEELPPGWDGEYDYAASDFAFDVARENRIFRGK